MYACMILAHLLVLLPLCMIVKQRNLAKAIFLFASFADFAPVALPQRLAAARSIRIAPL